MSPSVVRVGLVGVTGYTGMELIRLLVSHPFFRLAVVTSRQEAGQPLAAVYPFLQGFPAGELIVAPPDPAALAAACDLVFLAVPHGTAMGLAAELLAAGRKVVDLSADFRLRDSNVYEKWYGIAHAQAEALQEAVYGLPELYARKIAGARLVANPGCYPTASVLGLYPALAHGLIIPEEIIIDAKSGASGAGRGLAAASLFCEVQDNFRAYNLGAHRHTPEIEQELSVVAGRPLVVSFASHLLPVNRGILATIYTRPKDPGLSMQRIREAYASAYADHPFIRLLPAGRLPEIRSVRGTFFCDLALVQDSRAGRLIIVSAIDNLCRGASGQAVANANLMCGLPLGTGLAQAALVP
ncbi:MAG: N-acetyl-gamma-glutamyl-phosphate reductase [Deltaproteobacteria bacterium]|jgi:N-acetyl-gamma-glutamyl-phosphate reductase|nr:N-acetyl-gamma-glutamyl-phosphate reductase [Deltaproteobacteria bacterium]